MKRVLLLSSLFLVLFSSSLFAVEIDAASIRDTIKDGATVAKDKVVGGAEVVRDKIEDAKDSLARGKAEESHPLARFILSVDGGWGFPRGVYGIASPGVIFQPNDTYKVYQPSLSIDLGYCYFVQIGCGAVGEDGERIRGDADYMFFAPRFRNRFLATEHSTFIIDLYSNMFLFGRSRGTGEYTFLSSNTFSIVVGCDVGYYYFFNEHVGLGGRFDIAFFGYAPASGIGPSFGLYNIGILNLGLIFIV